MALTHAGVIIHPTSLPGPYGIGEIGEEAYRLVDWMVSAGLSMWQVTIHKIVGLGYFLSSSSCVVQSCVLKEPLLITSAYFYLSSKALVVCAAEQ